MTPEIQLKHDLAKELRGVVCGGCRRRKRGGHSFCPGCYYSLPPYLRKPLYHHIGDGYEAAYEAARRVLTPQDIRSIPQATREDAAREGSAA